MLSKTPTWRIQFGRRCSHRSSLHVDSLIPLLDWARSQWRLKLNGLHGCTSGFQLRMCPEGQNKEIWNLQNGYKNLPPLKSICRSKDPQESYSLDRSNRSKGFPLSVDPTPLRRENSATWSEGFVSMYNRLLFFRLYDFGLESSGNWVKT